MIYVARLVAWLVALAAVAAGVWFGRVVPFAEQWPMFEALRTTAAIIFAVIGAWMAIIYPDRLRLSLRNPDETSASKESSGLGKLFTPVVNSTAILCCILLIGAAAPVMKRLPLPVEIEWLRGASYGLLVALTLWQLWTVVLTLVPASMIKTFVDHEDGRRQVIRGLTRLTQPAASERDQSAINGRTR